MNVKYIHAHFPARCDLEAAFEKEIDIITVGAIMQEPAMPSDMDFKNTILNERVQLHDVA